LTWVRLHFVVEGQTEETFLNRVLVPHFATLSVAVDGRSVETGRRRAKVFRGGITSYGKLKSDLSRWMRQDDNQDAWFTTMVDLYGLGHINDEFPGYEQTGNERNPVLRVQRLEAAFAADISHQRFIPYLQLHEFEALLFTDPSEFFPRFERSEGAVAQMRKTASEFETPEHINEGENKAPSKRIIQVLPQYEGRKASDGPIIAEKIGLNRLRKACPHFDKWILRLEGLSQSR
jgi:hypothetical protein